MATLATGSGQSFSCLIPIAFVANSSADGKTLTTQWQGHTITLPANNIGKQPGAERHAMHGLILKAKTDDVAVKSIPGGQEITGVIHAGDFGGHWLSKTDLVFTISLTADAVDAVVVAKNVGNEAEPMAIGWHPYFNFPSGDRTQARLQIPASMLAIVDNYDNVFPTGKLVPVTGQYDLRAPGGKALDKNFYDDNWSHLDWKNGVVTVNIIDPAAKYGVKIEGVSPEIKTIQAYAPPAKELCRHRRPIQLRRSLRQGMGLHGHRHGHPQARPEHQVARPHQGLRALNPHRYVANSARVSNRDSG